jgi:hypothetical protein
VCNLRNCFLLGRGNRIAIVNFVIVDGNSNGDSVMTRLDFQLDWIEKCLGD